MGSMLEFITRMGYHFRWKIDGNRRIPQTCRLKNAGWGTIGGK